MKLSEEVEVESLAGNVTECDKTVPNVPQTVLHRADCMTIVTCSEMARGLPAIRRGSRDRRRRLAKVA